MTFTNSSPLKESRWFTSIRGKRVTDDLVYDSERSIKSSQVDISLIFKAQNNSMVDISGRYHHEERMMSDLRSRNSRYEETQITGRDAKNQLDDQVISTKDRSYS